MDCLDEVTIVAFLEGTLDAAAIDAVEAELDRCERCRELMVAVTRDWHVDRPHRAHDLPLGTTIGRYRLDRSLGAGAMGVVYEAFDPVVDRRVALKLLDLRTFTDSGAVLREAQAMGRVNHAAVVAIYDAGVTDAYVYVAMELVAGETLRQRLSGAPMTPRAWCALFAGIAEGLAAAHDAGVVHRDFKPENVLLDRNGLAKVTDFGLACVGVPAADTHAPGTPAYMAPEQLIDDVTDARSDQYSFAVVLYEALAGARPVVAATVPALVGAMMRPPAIDWSRITGDVKAVLQRALARAPGDRFATMHDVARALRRIAAPRRRPWIVAAVAGAVTVTTVGAIAAWPRSSADPCATADADVMTAWTSSQRSALRDAYAKVTAPYAARARDTAQRELETYATTLRAGYTAACRATHVNHTQSAELLDRRTQCLDRGTASLRATAQLFAAADATIVAHTTEALDRLADLHGCDDVATLADEAPVPSDPAKRTAVAEIRRTLAEAENALTTTEFDAGIALATAATTSAVATGYRPLEAEALMVLGTLQYAVRATNAARATFERAALAAAAGRSRVIEARIRERLAAVLGLTLEEPEQGVQQIDLGLALLETVKGSEHVTAQLLSTRAAMMIRRGDRAGALALLQRALAMLPDTDPGRASIDQDLGTALVESDRVAEALPLLEHSAAEARRRFGPDHPVYAGGLASLADAYQDSDPDKSIRLMLEAHAIYVKVLPATSSELAAVKTNLGGLLAEFGRTEEARPYLVEARAIEEVTLPVGHPARTQTLASLGKVELAAGHLAEALALTEAAERDDDPNVARVRAQRGAILHAMRRDAEALPILEAVLASEMLPDERAAVQFVLAQTLWATRLDAHRPRVRELVTAAEATLRDAGKAGAADEIARWRAQRRP